MQRKELLAELTIASEDTGALTLKDKCGTREQRGQMITDNREDRRVIGPGGRLKASGRDTGYTDTENGPPSVGGTMIQGRVSQQIELFTGYTQSIWEVVIQRLK